MVLNTGYTGEIAQQLLDRLNWKENVHFDAMITADDVSESRPSPAMIHLAMEKFNITRPESVLKAGDSVIDIEEGKMQAAGLLSPYYRELKPERNSKNQIPIIF